MEIMEGLARRRWRPQAALEEEGDDGGGTGGGRRWCQCRHASRGVRSGTHSRCSRPGSSTRTPWHRSARGTMTGCACRCACPTAPPCASSSSSCSDLLQPRQRGWPPKDTLVRLFMWTTPPPCAPTKGRPASWSYTLFREHYMSHEFKITFLEKMPKEDWWDYGLVSVALLGLSMTNKHGCKKFLLKIGLEKIPKEDWWDYIRFGDRSFTRTEYDEQAWMQEISPENRT